MFDWFEVSIKFINEWDGSWDVQLSNFFIRNVIKIFDKGTDTVSMSSNEDSFSCLDLWHNFIFPQWCKTSNYVLKAFSFWEKCWTDIFVFWVVSWIHWAFFINFWWWNIV